MTPAEAHRHPREGEEDAPKEITDPASRRVSQKRVVRRRARLLGPLGIVLDEITLHRAIRFPGSWYPEVLNIGGGGRPGARGHGR